MGIVDVITIVLSLVALVITILGFFASLKFYRDGSEMQAQARDALSKIEEKTATIQSQVGGMFDKTLNAALGISNEFEIRQQQSSLQEANTNQERSESLAKNSEEDNALADIVIRYFTFKQMRLTDVSEQTARAIFNLGGGQGFNLFNGTPGITFFGFFQHHNPVDIIAKVRILFTNLELAYKQIMGSTDNQLAQNALLLLNQISLELLIPEEVDSERLVLKIKEYQPSSREVNVIVNKPSQIQALVTKEYEKMKI